MSASMPVSMPVSLPRLAGLAVLCVIVAGCSGSVRDRNASTGALIGGATGAAIGAVSTGTVGGAAAGGVIGGAAGAIIGAATAPKTCYARTRSGRRVAVDC
jgi:hypothetical protein